MENHKMTTPQKLSVNVETGEESLIDLTADELADFESSVKAVQDAEVAAKAKVKSDAENKAALLIKLGITADEAKLLLS
jgi:hypothetical protein